MTQDNTLYRPLKITDFHRYKQYGHKLAMLTCYDHTFANIMRATAIDCVLIGDSVAMTMHGYTSTVSADMAMMVMHTRAVATALAQTKLIIADMPFLSFRGSLDKTIENAKQLMQNGAHGIKIEGINGNEKTIAHLVESGIPVMGHIGMMPQSVNHLGGYKVQGKTQKEGDQLIQQAKKLQQCGCFAIVAECILESITEYMTKALDIPVIGIGSGDVTDGHVLVLQDLLGLNPDFQPKFAKQYMDGYNTVYQAITNYIDDIHKGNY
jgi:3-methyl-2-oxobutanoate hydroxymethyltransferase